MRSTAAILGSLGLVFLFSAAGETHARDTSSAPAPADVAVVVSAPDVAVDTGGDAVTSRVAAALDALAPHVVRTSDDDALRFAFHAYYNYRAQHPERVRKPYLYFVDYGLTNATPRGYVFDMESLEVVEGPFTVAHGRGSSKGRNGVPTRFSNRPGSAMTSLGLYVTQETYGFVGHAGGRTYRSVGLRLQGVSGDFNDAARARGVVAHGAPYMSARDAGRSEGCPALEEQRAQRLLPMIANGALVFLYSPNDPVWAARDPWVNG